MKQKTISTDIRPGDRIHFFVDSCPVLLIKEIIQQASLQLADDADLGPRKNQKRRIFPI